MRLHFVTPNTTASGIGIETPYGRRLGTCKLGAYNSPYAKPFRNVMAS